MPSPWRAFGSRAVSTLGRTRFPRDDDAFAGERRAHRGAAVPHEAASWCTMQNPLSAELDVLRPTMLFGTLRAMAHNINRQQRDLRIFERGRTYVKRRARTWSRDIGHRHHRKARARTLAQCGPQDRTRRCEGGAGGAVRTHGRERRRPRGSRSNTPCWRRPMPCRINWPYAGRARRGEQDRT